MAQDAGVQKLSDISSMTELCFKYARAIDGHEFDLYREVFVKDMVLEFHGVGGGRFESLDAFLESFRVPPPFRTQHLMGNHEFALDGDSATGTSYVNAQHWLPELPGELFSIGGRYEDTYARGAEGWRISERHAHVMWARGNPEILAGLQQ